MSANGSGLLVIERILRDRQSIWQQVVEDRDLGRLTGTMLASSAVALACYGAVLGSFHSFPMAITSAIKLPLLFLVTLAICLPTLYLFNLVFGARLSVRQTLALVMVAITVTAMLAVAFAPISLFFLITAPNYAFFKLLNVAILALSAIVGLRFLTGGMQVLNTHGLLSAAPARPVDGVPAGNARPVSSAGHTSPDGPSAPDAPVGPGQPVPAQPVSGQPVSGQPVSGQPGGEPVPVLVGAPNGGGAAAGTPAAPRAVPTGFLPAGYPLGAPGMPVHRPLAGARVGHPGAERPASMTLLYIWIMLFGFVGTQLAWTLRPFFGDPGQDFEIFRGIAGNFYAEVVHTIGRLF